MAAGTGFAQTRRRALSRAEQGKALSLNEVEALLRARDADLERAMSSARHLRDLGWGDTVTYSRKVFIPLTMLCRDHCHYCTFAKPPAKLDHPYLSLDEVVAIADAGRVLGCKANTAEGKSGSRSDLWVFILERLDQGRHRPPHRWRRARG